MGLINEALRPVEFKDVFLLKEDRTRIEKWAQAWAEGLPVKKGLILAGPPGYGKTSMAYALANTMGWNIIEINGSETRTEDFIKRTVGMFSSYRDLMSFQEEKVTIAKVALIDEADHIYERASKGATGETGGYRAVAEILTTTKIPIIITMNEFEDFRRKKNSSISTILNLCETVNIKKLYERKGGLEYRGIVGTLTDKLLNYAEKMGLKPQRDVILDIVSSNMPDLRAAINDAEAYIFSSTQNSNATGTRDSQSIVVFDTLKALFHGPDFFKVKDAINQSDTDPEQLILWLSENIPLQSRTFQSTLDALQYLAKIDSLDRIARRHLYFRLLAYVSDLEALFWTKIDIKKNVFIKFQFSNYLSRMSKTRKTRSSRTKVAKALSAILHMSSSDAMDMRSILRIMEKNQKDFRKDMVNFINDRVLEKNSQLFNGGKVKPIEELSTGDLDTFFS